MSREDPPLIPAEMSNILADEFLNESRALFVGSGCSVPPPSKIPSAGELAETLANSLNGSTNSSSWCTDSFGKTDPALEEIAERVLTIGGGRPNLFAQAGIGSWHLKPPNEIHRLVTKMCAESLVSILVTTNYDTLIEKCFDELQVTKNPSIIEDEDWQYRVAGKPTIIKLHGSAERPESILLAQSHFENWDRRWSGAEFASLLRNHNFVFLAYSLSDPHIRQTVDLVLTKASRNPIWVLHNRLPEIDQKLEEMHVDPDTHQLVGEVEEFLREAWRNCMERQMIRIVDSRVREIAESHASNSSDVTQITDTAKVLARQIAGNFEVSDYLKIFAVRLDRPYLPFIRSEDKVGLMIFWLSVMKLCIDGTAAVTSPLIAFKDGFHLQANRGESGNLGIFLIDATNLSPTACLGKVQGYLGASGANEVELHPRLGLSPVKLALPNKVMILLIGSLGSEPTTLPLDLSIPFFKESRIKSTAVCMDTNECARHLPGGLQDLRNVILRRLESA